MVLADLLESKDIQLETRFGIRKRGAGSSHFFRLGRPDSGLEGSLGVSFAVLVSIERDEKGEKTVLQGSGIE
jgi:hypothetical protein